VKNKLTRREKMRHPGLTHNPKPRPPPPTPVLACPRHEAWGLVVYSVFRNRGVSLTRAIEVPNSPNVRFHSMITVRLGNNGEIGTVIDNTGGSTAGNPRVPPKVASFP